MLANQSFKYGDDVARGDVERDQDRQALSSEVVDHRKNLDLAAVVETIEHEVVTPDMIPSLSDGALLTSRPSAPALPRLQDDLQAFLSTDASHALPVDDPSFPP
jgi:hypothetical protein